jgi:bifunctional non-homologous end joining protein LigD
MLARPADELPVGYWSYEVKWDGVRCVARVGADGVTMQSRSGKTDYASRFAHVGEQLIELQDCVLDGELVTFDGQGRTFGLARGAGPAAYVVFDLLERDGASVRTMAIELRRELLDDLFSAARLENVIRSPVFRDGPALMRHVAEQGMEGVVAKRDGSMYLDGKRSPYWLKVKLRPEQEFVVVGWTDGKGERAGRIGGLVLGYWEHEELRYAGRVGCRTDMDAAVKAAVTPIGSTPLSVLPKEERDAHWCRPELVVQVAFQRWTEDGRLWHPICRGLRDDVNPDDVRREG